MSRPAYLARRYGFDALSVLATIEGTLALAFGHDSENAPRTTPWFTVPATALIMLPLLARRRFPFAAPFYLWLLAPTLTFVDGRLVPFTPAVSAAGMAGAFLLGNRRSGLQAWLGLAAVVG